MSLYLNYSIETKNEKIIAFAWSNTEIPVLAISTDKNKITFFQDEGINISDHDMIKDCKITSLTWHPFEMILSYGFADGRVGVWIDEENMFKEEKSIHDSKITMMRFNNTGNRLVSADEKGTICVWRFENALFKLCVYKQNYTIEEIFFAKFSSENQDAGNKFPSQDKLNTLFFFCNNGGMLYLADDANSSPEICRVGGKIKSLLFYEKDNSIILITSHMLLVKCRIYFNQQLNPKKIKLSIAGNPENIKTVWAGYGLLAMVSGDDLIRFFLIESEQAYFLSMSDFDPSKNFTDDIFNCIDFSFRKRILIAGTSKGKVYMWKCNLTSAIIPSSSDSWEPYCVVEAVPNISEIRWSNFMGLAHVITKTNQHSMLSETILQKRMNQEIKVIQISHKTLEIICDNNSGKFTQDIVKRIEMSDSIKGMQLYKNFILTWNGSNAFIYEVIKSNMNISKIHTIPVKSNILTINEDSILVGNGKNIDILSYEGDEKSKINVDSSYGEINSFNVNDKFLLVITSQNYFAVFDITRRIPKAVMNFRKFEKNKKNLGEIREGTINCKGTHIGILSDSLPNQDMRIPDTVFYIYDIEIDTFTEFEISSNRIPIELVWDFSDPRIFGVQTEYAKEMTEENELNSEENQKKEWFGAEFFVFFYTTEYGILKQESHKINRDIQGVFALCIPSIYFIISNSIDSQVHSLMEKKFQFFQGLEKVDDNIKSSLIDFSILMSSGKLDEAYKIVKNIKNPSIWENMAQICIKTKRLDVLDICLSNMRFSRGIKALREAKNEKEPEAKLAIVAMHLGMTEEAKILFNECGRYDLLIKFNISIGDYETALDISSKNERVSFKNTSYRIAQNYEKTNLIDKAIELYNNSGTQYREVPRMLISKGKVDMLESFINKNNDPNYFIWWASYCERNEKIDQAIAFYRKAKDYPNIVRILISNKNINEAMEICNETKDPGACFLVGRALEENNDIKTAIHYYGLSKRVNQAFRLAKENNMDSEIYSLGLNAPTQTKNMIADYFEKKSEYSKAAKLYQLGGNVKKALNICLVTQQFDLIREIADNVEYKNDPETLKSLAEYFLEQGQEEKALGIFIRLKDYEKALQICEVNNLKISVETADTIFDELDIKTQNESKKKLIKKLAKQLTIQGDFELAYQKYVQMNDLKKAMKCLIKLGDKDKVISFANAARSPITYVLAGNFLQSLEWIDNVDLMNCILSFYKKAKAHSSLSKFYEVCAMVEIDDCRDYAKAIEAWNDSIKNLELAKDIPSEDKQRKLQEISQKIQLAKLFVSIANNKNNIEESLKHCNDMLEIPDIDSMVREGDIYNLMVELYVHERDFESAYHVLEIMKKRKKVLANYVDPNLINKIANAVGKTSIFAQQAQNNNEIQEDF